MSAAPGASLTTSAAEVAAGRRFAFGRNWRQFIDTIDERHVQSAVASLVELLGPDVVPGRTFLDVGSGSGLSSVAALRLGASRVLSFDYDPDSVASTAEMRRRVAGNDPRWTVEQGDALNERYLAALGTFDVVYSWGVLHHTGAMWKALENVAPLVAPNGVLCVALYNDQGTSSRVWVWLKRCYNAVPVLRRPMVFLYAIYGELRGMLGRLRRGLPWNPVRHWRAYREQRGMSVWYDYVDWMGGYPFEVATPAQVQGFFEARGFVLIREVTVGGGLGCNEFVFRRA